MDKIRICKIQVQGLFGSINYNINFPETNIASIITAPNGCGKTTILNLVSFIFNPTDDSFKNISAIPFDFFRCVLSNGKVVELRRVKNADQTSDRKMKKQIRTILEQKYRLTSPDISDLVFSISGKNISKRRKLEYLNTFFKYSDMHLSDYYNVNDEDYQFYIQAKSPFFSDTSVIWKKQIQLLKDCSCNIPVNYIRADRIQPVMSSSSRRRNNDEPHQESPLKMASEKISALIKNATESYNEAVSQAKDKLPQMFLEGEGSELNSDEFMNGWSVYREELNQFQAIGLITTTKDFTTGKDISNVYKEKGAFLSTYLSAFKDTTASLRDIYGRLSLFKQILDERNVITGKKVCFSREGITMYSGDREIKLDTLSSGEKHDFIMFYNLIFNISRNGLVLIDEPEISLHIEWQDSYLDRLIAICEMNSLQAIVATHSPNIVSSHFDCLVDKGEQDG